MKRMHKSVGFAVMIFLGSMTVLVSEYVYALCGPCDVDNDCGTSHACISGAGQCTEVDGNGTHYDTCRGVEGVCVEDIDYVCKTFTTRNGGQCEDAICTVNEEVLDSGMWTTKDSCD